MRINIIPHTHDWLLFSCIGKVDEDVRSLNLVASFEEIIILISMRIHLISEFAVHLLFSQAIQVYRIFNFKARLPSELAFIKNYKLISKGFHINNIQELFSKMRKQIIDIPPASFAGHFFNHEF